MNSQEQKLLETLGLTDVQQSAVLCRDSLVLVTAGAGCGKTRTLVGRYLWAVLQGIPPRRMAAITFTEKAAREMRNRVRSSINHMVQLATENNERSLWEEAASQMDGARIGTIHSLCAELLRSQPVEALLDPDFTVLDEGIATVARMDAVRSSIAWAAGEETLVPLFQLLSPTRTADLVAGMITRRLDLSSLAEADGTSLAADRVGTALEGFLSNPLVKDSVSGLLSLQADGSLLEDAGEKLAAQIKNLLQSWNEITDDLDEGRVLDAVKGLFTVRRSNMALNVGKKTSAAKELLRQLREIYEAEVEPWLGGKARDTEPDAALEERYPTDLNRLFRIFDFGKAQYLAELDRRQALDFDGLEAGALALLENPHIRRNWQKKLDLLFVDEFQDTNARQRDILFALTEQPSTGLFLVGDARQSIYRFRGADVTVFRQMELETVAGSGSTIELQATFRAHEHLLRTLDILVGEPMSVVGEQVLYRVPYTALSSSRPENEGDSPCVSVLLGTGSNAGEARPTAAAALAEDLVQKKQQGEFKEWDEVAMLFRASTGFPEYEEALQARGIPFVTVAGKGFYERPEIRDVLNILAALASPRDDAAMAGLLRSPAMGMSDLGLLQLRSAASEASLFDALSVADNLNSKDESARLRALEFVKIFLPRVDRDTVSVLLKDVLDWLDYRPMLASTGARLWRNLDKLVEDARSSGMVRVRSFLQYVRTLRDVGVREGEAPSRAEGSVRLMTIHKAKGLEFPIVVLADASRTVGGRSSPLYFHPQTGFVFSYDKSDVQPLLYRYARWVDLQQEQAEDLRLLYVAATRAREKLVISGFLSEQSRGWIASGWTKLLLETVGLTAEDAAAEKGWREIFLENGESIRFKVFADTYSEEELPEKEPVIRALQGASLLGSVIEEVVDSDDDENPERDWRATGRDYAPAAAVGSMVHAALRSWLFPENEELIDLLEAAAFAERLIDTRQRRQAVRKSVRLLDRLRSHPMWEEINGADERYFEVPYTLPGIDSRGTDTGRIDMLYKKEDRWIVVDYKTENLKSEEDIQKAVQEYSAQMERYRRAVRLLLNAEPAVQICFLDAMESIHVESV
ncbi:MAG: UvrD-helicase domain-containing protein [Anaerolineales bacterium]|nr:UvrD-helicase domain-containing protein [Anaerolineales bacterium]